MLATRRPDDTNPDIPRVTAGLDLEKVLLQLQVAVDQLTRPEHHTLTRSEDDEAKRTLTNLRADYEATRAKASDHTRTVYEQRAHNLRADRLARDIIATARARTETPPLLEQIRDAVESSNSTGQTSGTSHPAPIGLAAAALLHDIEATVGRTDPTLVSDVRRWSARAITNRATQPDQLLDAAVLAERWVTSARQLLNPEKRYRPVRDAACPVCRNSHARITVEGERRREPALVVDAVLGWTTCRACHEQWPPEMGQWLGELLAQQRAERRNRPQP